MPPAGQLETQPPVQSAGQLATQPSARYDLLCWGIASGTISPRTLLTAMNPADGLTKSLTGRPFEDERARLLGLPIPHYGL